MLSSGAGAAVYHSAPRGYGLTWLFRGLSEPRRLLTRYLRFSTLFLYYLAKDALTSSRA
jgi:UDP-N-acetyl-D-mannosaminuronic acid transferase (WecB/TagA/CpsF family)